MNVAANPTAFFRLKDAQSYRFWNRNGVSMLDMTKGQVISPKTTEDLKYFRARKDVLVECDAHGVSLDHLGEGQIDTGKAKTYKVWGRAAKPVRSPQPLPSDLKGQPVPPQAKAYGTRVESNPDATSEAPPIPPDPMAGVPLPTANAAMAPATPPFPAEAVAPVATESPTAVDPFAGMSDDQKLTLQKQRIAAGFAPDPNLPIPDNGDPMIACLEKQIAENPSLRDALQPALDLARATAMAKLQQLAAGGGLDLSKARDPHRTPAAPRGSLLEELKNDAQSGKMNSPVEFANPDGTTDALSGR